MNNNLPPHLGGHMNKTHTDRRTLEFMRYEFYCDTILDIGCGPAGQLDMAKDVGYRRRTGIDGDHTIFGRTNSDGFVLKSPHNILIHDYTKGPANLKFDQYDLAWSVEFLEHVEEKYIPNFMENFRLCRYAVVTHALPGQDGHHHVNCQGPSYWIDKFKEYGFVCDADVTREIRKVSNMSKPFIKKTGLFFKNVN